MQVSVRAKVEADEPRPVTEVLVAGAVSLDVDTRADYAAVLRGA